MKGRCNTSGENVKAEVEYQTPVITQIAENLGVTITTPSGTNKQILQGNNANLLNIKNNAKKEGAYVWGKYIPGYYEPSEESSSEITASSATDKATTVDIYYSDAFSHSFDGLIDTYTLDSPSVISISYNSYNVEILKNKYFIIGGATGTKLYKGSDSISSRRAITSVGSNPYRVYISNALKIAETYVPPVLQDFLVSDDSNKYPDGAIQGDYWYEKVVDRIQLPSGVIKIAVDRITPAESMSFSDTAIINHSLGMIPSIVLLLADLPKVLEGTSNGRVGRIACLRRMDANTTTSYGATTVYTAPSGGWYLAYDNTKVSFTDSQVSFANSSSNNDSLYLGAGIEYTLITMV